MHTRVFDVLHDAADHDVGAVTQSVDVRLERVFQESVDEHRVLGRRLDGPLEISPQRGLVVYDLHGPSAEHIAGADQHGVPHGLGHGKRLFNARGYAVVGHTRTDLTADLVKALPVFGTVDRLDRGPQDRGAQPGELSGELERGLPPELHDDALRILALDDLQRVLEGQRLEVELVRDIEVR